MKYRDRLEQSGRLVERYAQFIEPRFGDMFREWVRHGELALAVEDLASCLVRRRIPLAAGDAVVFRRLLEGFERCPDTPPDIADLLLFGASPPDGYSFDFHEEPGPAVVAAAVAEVYAVPQDRIGVLAYGAALPEAPIALVSHDPGNGARTVRFDAGTEFGTHVGGASVLDVAKALCGSLGTAAMLGPRGLTPNQWVLVTAAGGHGVVMLDGDAADEGRWEIRFAYEPIKGAPSLPLFEPEW